MPFIEHGRRDIKTMKKTPLKRTKGINPISKKRGAELLEEKKLTALLNLKQHGRCADCGAKLGWRSAKHELKSRAQGGDPTEEANCVLLCGRCHSARHHIKEV